MLLSLVVLFSPGSAVPSAPSHTDKVVHVGVFLVLAVTARGAGAPGGAVLATLVAYAVGSEVLQALLPMNRGGGWADALTDVIGAAAGLVLVQLARRFEQHGVRARARVRARPAAAQSGAPGTAGPTRR